MALDKEKQKLIYKEQINVNRGRGYDFLNQQQKENARKYKNVLDKFASNSFQKFQKQQEKFGKELAENTPLRKTEVQVTDPVTGEIKTKMVTTGYETAQTDKLLTVSATAAFETDILDDYEKAVLTDGANIVEDTAKMFGKNINKFNEQEFNNLVEEQLEPMRRAMTTNMKKNFDAKTSIQTTQHRNQLVRLKTGFDQQVKNAKFKVEIETLQLEYAENAFNPIERNRIQENIFAIVDKYSVDTVGAIAQGEDIKLQIVATGKVYDALQPYFVSNMMDSSLNTQELLIENLNKLDLLNTGNFDQSVELHDFTTGQKVTVSANELITKDANTVYTRKALRQQISHLREILNRGIATRKSNNSGAEIYKLQASSNTKIYASNSGFNKWLDGDKGKQASLNAYNISQKTDFSLDDLNKDPVLQNQLLSFNIQTQGTPGFAITEKIKDAFATNNIKAIQELRDLGVLNMLTYAKSQYLSGIDSRTEYEVNRINTLFDAKTAARIKELVDSNEDASVLIERYKKADESSISLTERLKLINLKNPDSENGESVFTPETLNMYLVKQTMDKLSSNKDFQNLFEGDIGNSALMSQTLIDFVKSDARSLIESGTILTQDGTFTYGSLNKLVDGAISKFLTSGQIRVSKYGFRPFIPMSVDGQDDDTDAEDRGFIMRNAPEHYAITEETFAITLDNSFSETTASLDYVNDKIVDMVENSLDFSNPLYNADFKGIVPVFGKNIKLEPIRGTESRDEGGFTTSYYIIYVDPFDYKQIPLRNKNGEYLNINLQKERDDFLARDIE
tara:strand:+ start:629 stop:3004 length:2376 start_codon:yes stop_codon:yes gene_type:complete